MNAETINPLVDDMKKKKQKSRKKAYGNHHQALSGRSVIKKLKSIGFKIRNLDQLNHFTQNLIFPEKVETENGTRRIVKLELLSLKSLILYSILYKISLWI